MKWPFKQQDLQIAVLKLNIWVAFTHLKLWVKVASHNVKCVKNLII